MLYFVGFFVVALVVLLLFGSRRKGGYREDEHIARNTDPLNDPATRRFSFPWL